MYDYVKCAWHNKATRAGYGFIALNILHGVLLTKGFVSGTAFDFVGMLVAVSGGGLLGGSKLGLETLRAYHRTKRHFFQFGRLDENFVGAYSTYCGRSGVRLAATELGLTIKWR